MAPQLLPYRLRLFLTFWRISLTSPWKDLINSFERIGLECSFKLTGNT